MVNASTYYSCIYLSRLKITFLVCRLNSFTFQPPIIISIKGYYILKGFLQSNLSYCFRQNAKIIPTHTIANYSMPIHQDHISCDGTEDNVLKCRMNTFSMRDCTHREDISVQCQGYSSRGNIKMKMDTTRRQYV